MTSTQYNAKKLRPFKAQRDALATELKKLQQEYQEEERLNDDYFDEIGKAEREYDQLIKQIEKFSKQHQDRNQGPVSQESQGLDGKIEDSVKKTLGDFLLNQSKKDFLEEIQEQEQKKLNNKTIQQITMNKQIKQNEQNQDDGDDDSQREDGYYITLKYQGDYVQIKVPGHIKTFQELKQIVKSCFMAEEKQIFYADQLGNLLQFHMDVLEEIYPPIYELLRNYEPIIGVTIIKEKSRKQEEQQQQLITYQDEYLHTEIIPEGFSRLIRQTKKAEKKINWALYLGYANYLKYFFESCLFVTLLILYVVTQINSVKFVTNTQLLSVFSNNFEINRSYTNPIHNISELINSTLAVPSSNETFETYPLQSGILIQSLVHIQDLDDCVIMNKNQKQMFINKNQSCLNFDLTYTDDIEGNFIYHQINPSKYNSFYDGYVWELNLTNTEIFTDNYNNLNEGDWIQYNIKQSKFILNYYNSPSKLLVQITLTTLYLFNDPSLNYNSLTTQAFDLSPASAQETFFQNLMFYIAILLLVPSFFDFFGFYSPGTQNNIIVLYVRFQELLNRRKKVQAKKRDLPPQEEREFQQKKLILDDYFIIDLKILYITIKIPLIFDIICIFINEIDMMSNVSILIRSTIKASYNEELNKINVNSPEYQEISNLIFPLFLIRIYDGIQILFLMIAINRFLGNWSPFLKCYGLVMIRFNKESWFLLLVLVFIISICAMAWCITIQGRLLYMDNFFYSFIGLLRCTLKYGMHNDIAEQGLYNNYVKDISFSFDTRYIQYVIIMVISMIMTPIFISLMTQQVHNTKEEAKQKMMEYNK